MPLLPASKFSRTSLCWIFLFSRSGLAVFSCRCYLSICKCFTQKVVSTSAVPYGSSVSFLRPPLAGCLGSFFFEVSAIVSFGPKFRFCCCFGYRNRKGNISQSKFDGQSSENLGRCLSSTYPMSHVTIFLCFLRLCSLRIIALLLWVDSNLRGKYN